MAGIVDRLIQNARAYVYDFVGKRLSGTPAVPPWQASEDAYGSHTSWRSTDESPPFTHDAGAGPGLPHSAELARCYAALDLPFGTPLVHVTKRWKAYLRKCHPDLHAADAVKQAQATELTQQLNSAYDTIKTAWEQSQR